MKAYERLYREMLIGVLAKKKRFTQLELSKTCGVSLGLVNKTIKNLSEIGAVDIQTMQFRVIDPSKLIFDWAVKRSIKRDVSESYCIDMPITEIEKSLPFIFTAYSGWRLLTGSVPFDYSKIYIYVPLEDKKLFELWLKDKPIGKGSDNLFVVYTEDKHLINNSKKHIAPVPQIFADIYSLGELAGKYFVKEILEKYPLFRT